VITVCHLLITASHESTNAKLLAMTKQKPIRLVEARISI